MGSRKNCNEKKLIKIHKTYKIIITMTSSNADLQARSAQVLARLTGTNIYITSNNKND
jgi:hypothetical protein